MSTPTPRTDAMRIIVTDNDTCKIKVLETVRAPFARRLERELTAITAELTVALAKWNGALERALKAETERDHLHAQLRALTLICGTNDANKFETWIDRANARAEKAEGQLKELVAYASALEDQLDSVGVQIARTAMKEAAK